MYRHDGHLCFADDASRMSFTLCHDGIFYPASFSAHASTRVEEYRVTFSASTLLLAGFHRSTRIFPLTKDSHGDSTIFITSCRGINKDNTGFGRLLFQKKLLEVPAFVPRPSGDEIEIFKLRFFYASYSG